MAAPSQARSKQTGAWLCKTTKPKRSFYFAGGKQENQ